MLTRKAVQACRAHGVEQRGAAPATLEAGADSGLPVTSVLA